MKTKIKLDLVRSTVDYSSASTKTEIMNIPHGRPPKQEFIRIHPDPLFHTRGFVLNASYDENTYLISQEVYMQLEGLAKEVDIYLGVDRANSPRVIMVSVGGNRPNRWTSSLQIGIERAKKNWVRIAAQMNLQSYTLTFPEADFGEPVWPELSFEEVINLSFGDFYIDTVDHPVVKHLSGKN